jgi:hypothetical protein
MGRVTLISIKTKYVNKQLYCETTGLEFKYNETKIEWGVLETARIPENPCRGTGWHWILFKKGEFADVGYSASSEGDSPRNHQAAC